MAPYSDWQNKIVSSAVKVRKSVRSVTGGNDAARVDEAKKVHPCDEAFLADRGCMGHAVSGSYPKHGVRQPRVA